MKRVIVLVLTVFCLATCKEDNSPTLYSLDITITPENAGVVNPSQDTLLESGTQLVLLAEASEGYVFNGWSGDITNSENPLSVNIEEDISLVANFEKKSYSLSIDIIGEGQVTETIVQAKTDYDHGTVVQLTAVPDSNWSFVNWSGNASGQDSVIEVTVTSPLSITAEFQQTSFPVEVKVTGSGSLVGWEETSMRFFERGEIVSLQPKPDTTWVFSKWQGDLESDTELLEFEVTDSLSLELVFEEGVLDYCIPYSMDVYRHKSETDSLKTLDWDFILEDRKIVSYEKYYDVTKNGGDPLMKHEGTLSYSDNLLKELNHTIIASGITQDYTFSWNDGQLSGYDYVTSYGSSSSSRSTSMNYEDPCGLSFYTKESGEPGSDSYSTGRIDYEYSNICSSYYIRMSDLEISFEDNGSSIFKDLEGIPGFMGALYENTLFIYQDIFLPNKNQKRLSQAKLNFTPGRVELGKVTEDYSYDQFIVAEDYPRFFTRETTYADSDIVDHDTFVVDYKCSYKKRN